MSPPASIAPGLGRASSPGPPPRQTQGSNSTYRHQINASNGRPLAISNQSYATTKVPRYAPAPSISKRVHKDIVQLVETYEAYGLSYYDDIPSETLRKNLRNWEHKVKEEGYLVKDWFQNHEDYCDHEMKRNFANEELPHLLEFETTDVFLAHMDEAKVGQAWADSANPVYCKTCGIDSHVEDGCPYRDRLHIYKLSAFKLQFLPPVILDHIIELCKRHGYLKQSPNLAIQIVEEATRLRTNYRANRQAANQTQYQSTGGFTAPGPQGGMSMYAPNYTATGASQAGNTRKYGTAPAWQTQTPAPPHV